MAEKRTYTIDDLWEMSHKVHNRRLELVRGEIRDLPFHSLEHGYIAGCLSVLLFQFVLERSMGYVVSAVGFILSEEPPTVRGADIAFVPKERVLAERSRHFAHFVPELVAEVIERDDTFSEVAERIDDWLRAGVRLVWVVDPVRQTVHVYRADQPVRVLGVSDTLSGEEVLPGFECAVSEIFAR